jgi:ribonuclease HI
MDEVLGEDDDNENGDEDDDGSFDSEINDTDSSPDDPFGRGPRRGTGRAFPTKFVPPSGSASSSATPSVLFSGHKSHMRVTRQVQCNSPPR